MTKDSVVDKKGMQIKHLTGKYCTMHGNPENIENPIKYERDV
jgi:hypothetical protein